MPQPHDTTDHIISADLRHAQQFLAELTDPRAPWADRFEAWARERNLGPELARQVKATVLRLRMFAAVERSGRRRR